MRNIAADCGLSIFGGSSSGSSGDLSFLFKIEVDVEVLSITVPVNFDKNVSFPCPLSGSSLQGIIGGLGSALTGSARRWLDGDAQEHESFTAALVRRQLAKTDVVDLANKWERDMSAAEVVGAIADGLVRRYSPLSPTDDHHEVL